MMDRNTLLSLLRGEDDSLLARADQVRRTVYGQDVYIRGLIEISNFCKRNCLYCGIRAGNPNAKRYRLSPEEILLCANHGYDLGFRTVVLQGGEDPFFNETTVCKLVEDLKTAHPDRAVTLSLGEQPKSTYKAWFDAGADRYLLRHETAIPTHYAQLHPADVTLETRKDCLFALKEIGYQVGSGFMVGSPGQTLEHLAEDFAFLSELQPDMIGIGPFLPHCDTPFAAEAAGDLDLTLRTVALSRILFPHALIPATTALGTLHPKGRELGLKAGANVVMPNLSPEDARARYTLYNNKLHTGAENAEQLDLLKAQVEAAGYRIVVDRGDVKR
ncbi:MAG: [Oscillospiraceae bacterium]|nr:[FeFe] hydrogenase H-cluster radical SAM maturase HydE [Oscillospiraceae bacterium]